MKTFNNFINEVSKGHPDRIDPYGKLFKDKHSQLHLVVGGSKASPLSLTFDPKWGQISSMGTFGNDIENWVPWTKMVKKPIIKKFISAVEMELDRFKYDGRGMIDSEFQAKEAIRFLSRMGR